MSNLKLFISAQLKEGGIFVGHNVLRFDVPVLNKLVTAGIPLSRIVDTFVLSMLYNPNLPGGHSLDAWGKRLGLPKGDFNDFSQYSEEMLIYCRQDVNITTVLFHRLTERMRMVGFTEIGAELEHQGWYIAGVQQKNGFWFDKEEAERLLGEIDLILADLQSQIYDLFPPEIVKVKTFSRAYKKDGSPSSQYLRHLEQYPKIEVNVDGSYDAYATVEFNLGSPAQRIAKLLELGWEPKVHTKKGNPKVDESELIKFAEENNIPEIKSLAEWIVLNGRANAIRNWLNLWNPETGCIHGNLWLASTLRYRHDKPNTANIPAVRTRKVKDPDGTEKEEVVKGREGSFTYESRALWKSRDPKNRKVVGIDAKGIQLRVLAHYLNLPAFTEAILSEDPHSANQKLMGLPSRSLCKTITYATLMGAGDARVAAEANVSLAEAREAKAKFFATVPGLPNLIKRLESELERTGRITLCDGSKILVSSPHMVIPYLLQGDESRIMKKALIILMEKVRKLGLDVLKVGDIHDEWQFDVMTEHVELFLENALASFLEAGEFFNYNLPIEGDSKVGDSWAMTH